MPSIGVHARPRRATDVFDGKTTVPTEEAIIRIIALADETMTTPERRPSEVASR
jgi:hypothetical protein